VVGNGRLWPLAARGSSMDDAKRMRETKLSMNDDVSAPKSWTGLVVVAAIFGNYTCFAYVMFSWRGRRNKLRASMSTRNVQTLSPLRAFVECKDASLRLRQGHYRFVVLAVVAGLLGYIALVHLAFHPHFTTHTSLAMGVTVTLIVPAAGVAWLLAVCEAWRTVRRAWWQLRKGVRSAGIAATYRAIRKNLIDPKLHRATGASPRGALNTALRLAVACGLALVFLGLTIWNVFGIWQRGRAPLIGTELLVDRIVHLSNGVSPMMPVLLGSASVYLWALCHLHRLRLLDAFRVRDLPRGKRPRGASLRNPIAWMLGDHRGEDLKELEQRVFDTVRSPGSLGRGYLFLLCLVVAVPVVGFAVRSPQSLELTAGHYMLVVVLFLSIVVVGTTLVRLLFYWTRLQDLLRSLARHPIAAALGRLPPPFAKTIEAMIAERADVRDLSIPLQRLRLLSARFRSDACVGDLFGTDDQGGAKINVSEIDKRLQLEVIATHGQSSPGPGASAHAMLLQAGSVLVAILDRYWRTEVDLLGPSTAPASHAAGAEQSPSVPEPSVADPLDAYTGFATPQTIAWLRSAEEYVAMLVALSIGRLLRHFRHFVTMVTAGSLLFLLTIVTYSFEPHRMLLTIATLIIAAVVGAGLYIFVQLDRNELLSRIAKTPAGTVTFSGAFIGRIFAWGVLPLLSVVMALYPDVVPLIFSWLDPFTKRLH